MNAISTVSHLDPTNSLSDVVIADLFPGTIDSPCAGMLKVENQVYLLANFFGCERCHVKPVESPERGFVVKEVKSIQPHGSPSYSNKAGQEQTIGSIRGCLALLAQAFQIGIAR